MNQVSLVLQVNHSNFLLQFLAFVVTPFFDLVFIDPMNQQLTPVSQKRHRTNGGCSCNYIAINVGGKIDQDLIVSGCNVLGNSHTTITGIGHVWCNGKSRRHEKGSTL